MSVRRQNVGGGGDTVCVHMESRLPVCLNVGQTSMHPLPELSSQNLLPPKEQRSVL